MYFSPSTQHSFPLPCAQSPLGQVCTIGGTIGPSSPPPGSASRDIMCSSKLSLPPSVSLRFGLKGGGREIHRYGVFKKCGWHYQLVYILYTYSNMELCNISRTCNVYIKCIFFNFSFLYRLFSANIF